MKSETFLPLHEYLAPLDEYRVVPKLLRLRCRPQKDQKKNYKIKDISFKRVTGESNYFHPRQYFREFKAYNSTRQEPFVGKCNKKNPGYAKRGLLSR